MLVKRTLRFTDEVSIEAGQRRAPPLREIAVAAAIKNPFAGRFARDLGQLTRVSAEIGQHFCQIAAALFSRLSLHTAARYGKATFAGAIGERQHSTAKLTTAFGNVMREKP